jgi:hypothetical protein
MATSLHEKAFRSVHAHFPTFQIATFCWGLPLILGKKQQNQQNPAKENAAKGLG